MSNLTNVVNTISKTYFLARKYHDIKPIKHQKQFILGHIINNQSTQWAKDHQLDKLINLSMIKHTPKQVRQFAWSNIIKFLSSEQQSNIIHERISKTPITQYSDHEPYIHRMMQWHKDELIMGVCSRFAKTSGTTGNSKYLPVTKKSLQLNHFKAWQDLMSYYCAARPDTQLFEGKTIVVWWWFEPNPYKPSKKNIGYISAILQHTCPTIGQMMRVPRGAKCYDWSREQKMDYIITQTIDTNITSIGWLPSWWLMILEEVCKARHTSTIQQIRPHFELYISGGMKIEPFVDRFVQIVGSEWFWIWQAYNASEWFFACQTHRDDPRMLLLTNHGIYYEFIIWSNYQAWTMDTIPLEQTQTWIDYVLVITTVAWLWRYVVGDIVRFTNTDTYYITVTGRTKYMMSMFDERVTGDDIEQTLIQTCSQHNVQVRDYSVTTRRIWLSSGYHHWAIEFITPPADLKQFIYNLDHTLGQLREDYDYVRQWDQFLLAPQITVLAPDTCARWMKSKGKLWWQHKLPKLSTDTTVVDELCKL